MISETKYSYYLYVMNKFLKNYSKGQLNSAINAILPLGLTKKTNISICTYNRGNYIMKSSLMISIFSYINKFQILCLPIFYNVHSFINKILSLFFFKYKIPTKLFLNLPPQFTLYLEIYMGCKIKYLIFCVNDIRMIDCRDAF